MDDAKQAELDLIARRPDAPLVRLKVPTVGGVPKGTLGYIHGVKNGFVEVVLAHRFQSDPQENVPEGYYLAYPHEVENV